MKTIVSVLFLFLTSLLYGADSTASNISLRTFLENSDVHLNKEVIFHVELTWEGDLQRYHITEVSEPALTNLKLRGSGSTNRFYTDDQGRPLSLKRITYYFTPLDMGMGYIDGVSVRYQDINTEQLETLFAQRLGVKIIEPERESGATRYGGQLLLLGIVLAFLIVFGYFLRKYFKIRKQEQHNIEIELTIEEQFEQDLKNLIKQKTGDTRADFGSLMQLLKQYLSRKYGLDTGHSFEQAKTALKQKNIQGDVLEKLNQIYKQSELSKFAGENISESEFHLYADTVELLFDKLKDEKPE